MNTELINNAKLALDNASAALEGFGCEDEHLYDIMSKAYNKLSPTMDNDARYEVNEALGQALITIMDFGSEDDALFAQLDQAGDNLTDNWVE